MILMQKMMGRYGRSAVFVEEFPVMDWLLLLFV
jgi:hypothetical protein